jgi:hypothetical protein
MKLAWKLLSAAGLLLVWIAMEADTTVSIGSERIHNLGMQQQQLMLLILGCVLFLAGVMLFGVLKLKQTPEEEAQEKERLDAQKKAIEEKFEAKLNEWSGGAPPAAPDQPPPKGSKQIELLGDMSDFFRG